MVGLYIAGKIIEYQDFEGRLKKSMATWPEPLKSIVEAFMDVAFRAESQQGNERLTSGIEMFTGAHVRILGDHGNVYGRIKQNRNLNLNPRRSSHVSGKGAPDLLGTYGDQHEIVLPDGWGSILLGSSPFAGYATHTWFQCEATAGDTYTNIVWHTVVDWVQHKATGQQVGQIGYSKFSEKGAGNALMFQGQVPPAALKCGTHVMT